MKASSIAGRLDEEKAKQRNYLYTVLNLPENASEAQIRERHRALSLIFHPDKQRNELLRESASAQFLEVQAAYEILTNPFTRQVYDILGYEGLRLDIPEELQYLPEDELPSALRRLLYESHLSAIEKDIQSRATITGALDARELFYDGWLAGEWFTDLKERLAATSLTLVSLRHTFTKQIGQQTRLRVATKLGRSVQARSNTLSSKSRDVYVLLRGNILGTISHQLSPSKQIQLRTDITQLQSLNISWSHHDPLNFLRVSAPLHRTLRFPPISMNYRRRLYRDSLLMGSIDYTLPRNFRGTPSVNIMLIKPSLMKASLSMGWTCGIAVNPMRGPALVCRWQLASKWLSAVLRFGIESGLVDGVACTAGGEWMSESRDLGIDAEAVWGLRGVTLNTSFTFLGQTLVMPIILSETPSLPLVVMSILVPSSALLASAYTNQRRRRTLKRQKFLKDLDTKRCAEAEEITELLRDVAHRSAQSERKVDGLVITEALYFPINDDGLPLTELRANVTVPLQADVRDGQLYIPGGRSKSVLRGFYDPLENCAKRLSVRYEFRGRPHYAEFGDQAPVLLPLESHLVDSYKT